MGETSDSRIPIGIAADDESTARTIAGLVERTGHYRAVPIVGADDGPSGQVARAFVVHSNGPAAKEVHRILATRAPGIPLMAIGSPAVLDAHPDCWLERLPVPGVFGTLLTQLVPASAPATRMWVRKSDMIVGSSPAIKTILRALDRLAPVAAPVLLMGEPGTGKELVARTLHYSGPRTRSPLLALNCAATPPSLIESELFGHVRGAFTGAVFDRAGVFESAQGGTVFLDALDQMPLPAQERLLEILETGEVSRLGSSERRKVDARLVAATDRDLESEVKSGRFREDLFYRVSLFVIRIPPLRERPEDVPALVVHHVAAICERERKRLPVVTQAALARLMSYPWPGNARELVHTLQRAVLAVDGGMLDEDHLELPEAPPVISAFADAELEFERNYYSKVLRATSGDVNQAALLAGRTPTAIREAIRRLGLQARGSADGDAQE